jgi:replicative superfamily II helicase
LLFLLLLLCSLLLSNITLYVCCCHQVGLLIIDEIHLLGADRGPVLEVIVSRMR